jgi:signal transduction histidine kinase
VELYDPVAEEKDVRFRTELADGAMVDGDRDLLASAIANLIDNAIKYAGSPAEVSVRTIATPDAVCVVVQDNGPGIAAAERAKIGTRFFRLNAAVPGYGLGLASVMAIAHLHHATFKLDDASPGLVATLTFKGDATT